jgi:hypothetical protein
MQPRETYGRMRMNSPYSGSDGSRTNRRRPETGIHEWFQDIAEIELSNEVRLADQLSYERLLRENIRTEEDSLEQTFAIEPSPEDDAPTRIYRGSKKRIERSAAPYRRQSASNIAMDDRSDEDATRKIETVSSIFARSSASPAGMPVNRMSSVPQASAPVNRMSSVPPASAPVNRISSVPPASAPVNRISSVPHVGVLPGNRMPSLPPLGASANQMPSGYGYVGASYAMASGTTAPVARPSSPSVPPPSKKTIPQLAFSAQTVQQTNYSGRPSQRPMDGLQWARTSFPSSVTEKRHRRFSANFWKMAVGIAGFVVLVAMIFSEPEPEDLYLPAKASENFVQLAAVPAAALEGPVATMENTVKEAVASSSATAGTSSEKHSERRDRVSHRHEDVEEVGGDDRAPGASDEMAGAGTTFSNDVAPMETAEKDDVDDSPPSRRSAAEQSEIEALLGIRPAGESPAPEVEASGQRVLAGVSTLPLPDASPQLPQMPGRDQVQSAMQSVAARVSNCGTGQSGKLIAKITISGATGQVVSAQIVDDVYQGTEAGMCAAREIRRVRLPRFQKESLVIRYPFKL